LWESAAYLSKLEFGIEDGIFIRSYIMNLKKDNMDLKKDIMDLKKDIMDLKTHIINLRKDIMNLRKYIYIQAIKTF
jgi:ribosomal protein S15P/S13E